MKQLKGQYKIKIGADGGIRTYFYNKDLNEWIFILRGNIFIDTEVKLKDIINENLEEG